jgi:hypothetical protein
MSLESKDCIALTLREGLVIKTLMKAFGENELMVHALVVKRAMEELRELSAEIQRLSLEEK